MPNFFLKSKSLNKVMLCLITATLFACNSNVSKNKLTKEREGQKERQERDLEMMKDPSLGYVPTDRLLAAKEFKDQLIQSQTNAAIAGINWRQLGPKNQGGRSRTMLVDANDATGNTVWVGSVGGGLWKTTNITATEPAWAPVDDFLGNLAITSIVQDPSNPTIMYFCTGETGYFNVDGINGLGVWKSINSGVTWSQLSATNNSNFFSCQRMIVNSTGVVMVATTTGLRRSTNGGTSFTKVLGTGLSITGANSNRCCDIDIDANGNIFATLGNFSGLVGSIHKSTNGGASFASALTLPITGDRIEVACAPNDANYLYALFSNEYVVNGIIKSIDGGLNWTTQTEPDDADTGIPNTDFSRGQAWYDLTIAVDPNNRDVVFVGGIDIFKSFDGCATWSQITHWYGGFGFQNVHADQHYILFQPGSSTIAYFANDGGIYRSTNASNAVPTLTDKGTNYITAQFYSCAIHPTAVTNYFLAGAQDNGSHQFTQDVVQNTTEVTGGDGAYVHIDQNQPQFQFTSYVFNNFYRSTNSGSTWTSIGTTGGDFISPTDYDDANNLLYMNDAVGSYRRWDDPQTGSTFTAVSIAAFGGGEVSAIKVSPNTNHKVFFGLNNGRVVRVDNANTAVPTETNISTGLPVGGYVSCIEVQTGNDNHLLVTYSNYGINSVWESIDGGTSWTSVEGNLPDMPIRWALFNPNNNDQAVLATELGVWTTDNLNGGTTVWGTSNSGLANVRVDMLQLRQSDKVMIAATHGRGLFMTSFFAPPTALFTTDRVTSYRGVPINFTSTSYNGTSWSWNFGDAGTAITENPSHIYNAAGKYNVTLTINSGASTITKNLFIHILPNKGTPYAIASGGNFETNTLDFGVDNTAGTPWERGTSAVAGKNGFVSASNAWVTGLTGNYLNNTDASLMTPNYNFTALGGYTMRFQSKRSTEAGFDGFRVEYTLDSGRNWLPLGTTVQAGWYNFANAAGESFPINQAYFSGNATTFTLYSYDMTFLGGNRSVAFRIRFKSDGGLVASGVAIDDFEIVGAINIALAVKLINFSAAKNANDVNLNWLTNDEKDINNYIIEKSVDGQIFTPISTIAAQNNARNIYSFVDRNALLNTTATTLYYRLRIIDNAARFKYSDVAKVQIDKNNTTITVGPNPFTNYVSVYSSSAIKYVSVFNTAGNLIFTTSTVVGNKIYLNKNFPTGTYLFKIKTESGEVVRKLIKN